MCCKYIVEGGIKNLKIAYEFPLLLNDSTIKYLFQNEETKAWIIEIIKWLTDLDLKEYEIYDNELNTGNKRKDYQLDLILKKENTFVIIEINTINKKTGSIKDYQYLFRIVGNFYEIGEKNSKKYVKLIRLNNFVDGDECLRHFIFKDDVNKVIESFESYEVYLPKYGEKDYNKASEMEKKVMMLTARNESDIKKYASSEDDKRILRKLEELKILKLKK